MSRARKIFIGRVLLAPSTATSLFSLMQSSALLWGYEADGTTPSLDSIIGSNCGVIPDGPVRISSEAATAVTGIALAGGQSFSLQDFGPDFGIIDPNAIFFWSVGSGTGMDVTFTAR